MNKPFIIGLILIIVISLIPLTDLMTPGLPVTHDGRDHVARIANFYESITEGNLVPRWAGKLNWGYGHPIVMFLYPLPSYAASLFHFLGFSFVDSTKLVFGAAYVVSGVGMYLWLSKWLGVYAGIVGALLYVFSPYRFVDLYVRGAIGEHVAFAAIPFVFLGIYTLGKKRKYGTVLASVSLTALLLSHNAVSLMMIPIVLLYCVYVYTYEDVQQGFVQRAIVSVVLGMGLSSFFWIPGLFEGKYTLRDIVTDDGVSGRFVPWNWFFYSPWNYGGSNEFTKSLGAMPVFFLLINVIQIIRVNSKPDVKVFLVWCTSLVIATLFLMTDQSIFFWETVSILKKFQFPWRLLTVTTLLTSVIGGVIFSLVKKSVLWFLVLTVLVTLVTTSHMWHAKGYQAYNEAYFTGIYEGTTDTGESSPIWSVRFMEKRPKAAMEIIEGSGNIKELERTSTRRRYLVEGLTPLRLVENTLYFPGWNVTVNGENVVTQFQDPTWRGLMTFAVPSGASQIDIFFRDTKVRSFSLFTTALSILVLVIYFVKPI